MKWIKRIVFTLIISELLYLFVFNAALNIQFTQTLINKMKPEKFQVSWDRAWTLYPFRLHVENISANGETGSQQWQADLQSASASISLLPLLQHKVKVYNVKARDANYLQRSKMKPEKDYTRIAQYFPSIEGRELKKVVVDDGKIKKIKKHKKAWHIDVDDVVAYGHHTFWINQLKGDLSGDLKADVTVETKGGPFSLSQGRANIMLNSLLIDNDQMVLKESKILGDIEISPIIFKQNKGKKALKFFTFDLDIKAQMGNLDFLDIYLHSIKDMQIDGQGFLDGFISFDKGVLLSGTALKIDANELSLAMLDHEVKGNGKVELNVRPSKSDELDIKILFDDLQAYYTQSDTALFSGKGLFVEAKGDTSLFPESSKAKKVRYLNIDIPSVKVEDLGQFQRYIPEKWRFKLYEGEGLLQANAKLSQKSLKAELKLRSKDAHIGISERHFKSDLDTELKLDINSTSLIKADLSGSYLSLSNSKLFNQKKSDNRESKTWDTRLNISKGTLIMPLPDLPRDVNSSEKLSKEERMEKMKELITQADANLAIFGSVSQRDWINLLMKNSLNLSLSGHGEIDASVELEKGLLSKGSALHVKPKELEVHLLDYSFNGDGAFSFEVTKGGENPDVKFDLGLNNAQMKRGYEKEAMIDNVVLKLNGVGKNIGYEGLEKDVELHMQIPSAKVKKVALYNQFLPQNSPFKFIHGSADLRADIKLKTNDAKGYVSFKTDGFTMEVDEQKVSARLNANVKIIGGVPRKMDFDISGSSIVLDQAKVIGGQTSYTQPDWSATVSLKKAHAIWKKPIRLRSETTLKIKDSRPIVAMIDNKRQKHGLISKLLTIKDISGTARVNMANNVITIPSALLKSDKIDLGAKGIISPDLRDAVFFFRYKHLKGLLKIRNGEKNFDILHVQDTFDNYVIPVRPKE